MSSTIRHGDFVAIVEYEPEEKLFYGRVVNTRDVIDFWANRADEIENEFAASIEAYLESCAEEGVEPEKPYSGKFQARLGEELHRKVATAAALSGKSMNEWITEVLERETKQRLAG